MERSDAATLQRARWLLGAIKGLNREIMNAMRNDSPDLQSLKSERARLGAEFDDMPRWAREEAHVSSANAARQLIEAKCFDDEKAARLMRFVASRKGTP